GTQVAAFDQAQGVQEVAAEHVRAAAVERQGCDRLDRVILALAGTEVAFEAPERRDDRSRDPKFLFLTGKQSLVLLDLCNAVRDAATAEHLVRHFQERLRKETLAAVDIDDSLVEDHV